MDYDAIVIGSGVGGLAAGGALTAAGLRTVVLEQAGFVGGCASSFSADGYTFDVGACIIEMARVHDWFYQRLGLRREDYLEFMPNDPLYEVFDILEGKRFTMPASLEGVAEIIAGHSPADARAFLGFMHKQGKQLDDFCDIIFTTPQGRMRDLARVFTRYPRIIPTLRYVLKPYGKLLQDLFEHPYTRRLMSNYSVIGGLPPSLQSGMMLWLCYAEQEGMFYPRGGMGAVPRAMARALADVGCELRLKTKVDRVIVEKGRARGVVLADGTHLTSRVVVSGVHAHQLYLEMIGRENLPGAVPRALSGYRLSPSCCVGYLGLDCRPPMAAQHIFALTDPGLIDVFWRDIYDAGIAIPQSVGLVSCPSFMDESLAPPGGAAVSFISMVPPHPRSREWSAIKHEHLEKGIDMVDAMYLPGIKDHVVFKTIATPEDFERRLLIPDGCIYSYNMSILNQMVFRPANRSRCVPGLYLCGASTHPSGSVPGAICGGLLAAELAAEDLGRRRAA